MVFFSSMATILSCERQCEPGTQPDPLWPVGRLRLRGENLHLENGFPVFTAVCKEERVQVHLKVMGNHMVSNALAALAVASRYGIPLQKAAAALEQFDGFKGRQQIIKEKGVTIIDDSYNASPFHEGQALRCFPPWQE